MANLRLIRRVRGVPRRVLQDVASQHRWRDRAVVPRSNQTGKHLVLVGNLTDTSDRLGFAERLAEVQIVVSDAVRHGRIDQPVD